MNPMGIGFGTVVSPPRNRCRLHRNLVYSVFFAPLSSLTIWSGNRLVSWSLPLPDRHSIGGFVVYKNKKGKT